MKINSAILPFAGVKGKKGDTDPDAKLKNAAKSLGVSVAALASIVTSSKASDKPSGIAHPNVVDDFASFALALLDVADGCRTVAKGEAMTRERADELRESIVRVSGCVDYSSAEKANIGLLTAYVGQYASPLPSETMDKS